MRASRPIAAAFLIWAALVSIAGTAPATRQAPALTGEYKPPPPPPQPIPYSHKTHLALGLACAKCHETAETGARATLPPTATCMECHTVVQTESGHIQKLKDWDDKKQAVPWRRVYRLPDYVFFSHTRHVSNGKVTCEVCHGSVSQM